MSRSIEIGCVCWVYRNVCCVGFTEIYVVLYCYHLFYDILMLILILPIKYEIIISMINMSEMGFTHLPPSSKS